MSQPVKNQVGMVSSSELLGKCPRWDSTSSIEARRRQSYKINT